MKLQSGITANVFSAFFTIVILTAGFGTAVRSEEAAIPDHRCWTGSQSFTEGATARASGSVKVCAASGKWELTDEEASVCIAESKSFSTGAVINVAASPLVMRCLKDGTWEAFETKK